MTDKRILPQHITKRVESALENPVEQIRRVFGGDINESAIITLKNRSTLFIKWNLSAPKGVFEAEAKGLTLLHQATIRDGLIRVPTLIHIDPQFLVMEALESSSVGDSYEFGRGLAKMHRDGLALIEDSHLLQLETGFGLDHDNFIGSLSQRNTLTPSWGEFYVLHRIEPQINLLVEKGWSVSFNRKLAIEKIESLFFNSYRSLLHGDLWGGNAMFLSNSSSGQKGLSGMGHSTQPLAIAAIYDPAVYVGHPEMDLAMTRLFGGFEPDFYRGYQDEWPIMPGWEERVSICQLYPILVHANLFGGGYVDRAFHILQALF